MVCIKCKEDRPIERFRERTGDDRRHGEYRTKCLDCSSGYLKAWKASNKEKVHSYRKASDDWRRANRAHVNTLSIVRKYGLTIGSYAELLSKHNYQCAICPAKHGDKNKKLHVDHDHKTGVVRGLLCGPHNRALGLFKDDPYTLVEASKYLLSTASLRKVG